jgi:hypothetical protein
MANRQRPLATAPRIDDRLDAVRKSHDDLWPLDAEAVGPIFIPMDE